MIELLKEKVKRLTEASGVEVDKEMHDDLAIIMDEMTKEVENKFDENSFEHSILETAATGKAC